MKLLITGASGMLGHTLVRHACVNHEVWGIYRSFPVSFPPAQTFSVNLTDEAQIRERLVELRPEAIIHAAALTHVDECEKDPSMAKHINVQATERLAMVAGELRARFVYISTDYVFNGKKGDYVETDPPSPMNVYGETKLLGEEAVRSCCPNALVIRTSIFGSNVQPRKSVVEYAVNALEKGEPINRFSDQFSTPIYTGDLSRLILEMLDRGFIGLFHVGGGEKISRYGFALKVADIFSLPREMIQPVPFEQSRGLAQRPRDSSLCGNRVEGCLGIRLPKIEEGLERLKRDRAMHQKSREGK